MKNRVVAAAVVAFCLAAPASSAVIEFETNGLLMADAFGGTGLYTPSGTFLFDTETESVYDVNVSTFNADYVSGSFDSVANAFGLFTVDDLAGLVLDIQLFEDIADLIVGLDVGDTFSIGADPSEFDNDSLDLYGFGIDPFFSGTILSLAPPVVPIPVPAGLPLLLGALGGLALLRRRNQASAGQVSVCR